MTARKKDNLLRGDRTPAFVDRATGAAELCISPETWDSWVDEGRLPPVAKGFPESSPRWRWADVDPKLTGGKKIAISGDPFMSGAANMRNGPKENARGKRAA